MFLFFGLLGLGGVAVIMLGLFLGYRQLADPDAFSAFVTTGVVAALGVVALAAFVWRLFDEHVSKPIERLAAHLRVGASADIAAPIDDDLARYLGDLAPAANALNDRLEDLSQGAEETVQFETARLRRQRAQLLQVLSDLPVAVIVATNQHKIVLYDGQAAALMEREAPARLNGSVFDYLDEDTILKHLAALRRSGADRDAIILKGVSGTNYTGHLRLFAEDTGYTLMLEPLSETAARPLVYDLDLFDHAPETALDDVPLSALSFVVFDSETTGLDPQKDEVVQLGAVRVVNGKIVAGEVFDTLVKPPIPIPPQSTKVHHIDDGMVADAPPFADAHAGFHAFAHDAVIVAHNAPFDMAFLKRQTQKGGPRFDNPVVDTVHLSAIVFGGSEVHTLDALSARLDVKIAPELRHTALGDAMATAEVLVAMLPILEARGFTTLRELRPEIQKHRRILEVQT